MNYSTFVKSIIVSLLITSCGGFTSSSAQLNTVFYDVFQRILGDDKGQKGAIFPVIVFGRNGQEINHASHFIDESYQSIENTDSSS